MSKLANKIKLNKNIKSTHKYGKLAILLTIAVLNTACLIEDVVQQAQVDAGSTFSTTVTVSSAGAEANPHPGAMAMMVPNDWSYTSGSFTTTDDIGSGEMIVDPDNGSVWLGGGDITTYFTTPDNMMWVFLVSDQGSATDAGVEHVATLNFDVGSTSGIYSLGYVATLNTADMIDYINADDVDDAYAGVDTSFNHPVEVVTTSADVLINEFDTNTSSSEYIELFNTTAADIDLAASAYSLVFYNGNGDSEYQATALTGTIPANGFFVLAESAASDLYGYTPDQNASWTSFQNGTDAVALVANGTQVDAIIYGSSADTGLETLLGLSGILISNGTSGSSSRVTDGQGGASYANDDWHIAASRTPGSTNEVAPPSYTAYTIVEIQTPVSDSDDASQHEGEFVETSGVITAATSYSFYMQDGTADYSGIYVYNSPGTAILGDNVTVTGTVFEQY